MSIVIHWYRYKPMDLFVVRGSSGYESRESGYGSFRAHFMRITLPYFLFYADA